MKLDGQVAVITGAGRGLGRAIAFRLAREGARVCLCARSEDELLTAVDEIRGRGGHALHAAIDIRDYPAIEAFIDKAHGEHGPIDVLVNNAGLGWYKPFTDQTLEEIDLTLDVNLKGLVFMTRAVLPDMLTRGQGSIVNIASDLGRRPLANMAAYVAAKHGVMGFAGSLLREVKDKGVKIMTVTPGIIDTYFGGTEAGTRDARWSLKPEQLADLVCHMLTLPEYVMMDEVSVHPQHQDF